MVMDTKEIKRLEQFKDLVYYIASVRMDTNTIIRKAKQAIADYEGRHEDSTSR